jgi:hypothetical protein
VERLTGKDVEGLTGKDVEEARFDWV